MPTPLAVAIARAARRYSGLRLLLFPDGVPERLLEDVVRVTNAEARGLPGHPPRAVLLADEASSFVRARQDEPDWVVGTRKLPELRLGDRLVVGHQSSYSGIGTLASVFPLLLPNSFPRVEADEPMLGALSEALATLRDPADDPDLATATRTVMLYLAAAHEREHAGDIQWRQAWWAHIGLLADGISRLGSVAPAAVWAIAALPRPHDPLRGYAKQRSAKRLVQVLEQRWNSDADALQRIRECSDCPPPEAAVQTAVEGFRAVLPELDGSRVSRVAYPLSKDAETVTAVWAEIGEDLFFDGPGTDPQPPGPICVVVEVDGHPVPSGCLWDDVVVFPPSRGSDSWDLRIKVTNEDLDQVTVRLERGAGAPLVRSVLLARGPAGLVYEGKLTVARGTNRAIIGKLVIEGGRKRLESRLVLPVADALTCVVKDRRAPQVQEWRDGDHPLEFVGNSRSGWGLLALDPSSNEDAALLLEVDGIGLAPSERGAAHHAWMVVPVEGEPRLLRDGVPVATFTAVVDGPTTANPLLAAVKGVDPTPAVSAHTETLCNLERLVMEAVGGGQGIGHVVLSAAPSASDHRGSQWQEVVLTRPDTIRNVAARGEWQLPSRFLTSSPEWAHLSECLRELPTLLASETAVPSQRSWATLPQTKVEEASTALLALIRLADAGTNRADRFWARFPASVVVLEGDARNSVAAVLLSPFHPVRLAWRWRVETQLRSIGADNRRAADLLGLVDGVQFPLATVGISRRDRMLSIPIDLGPDQVFVGWSALAPAGNAPVPRTVDGMPFPVAARSGLGAAAVATTLSDFLGLHPEVVGLAVELASAEKVPRSRDIDRALVDTGAALLASGDLLSMRVLDHPNREGEPEALLPISAPDAHGMAPVTWLRGEAGRSPTGQGVHVRFVEDTGSELFVDEINGIGPMSFISDPPLRRLLLREESREPAGWRFTTELQDGGWAILAELLRAVEDPGGSGSFWEVCANSGPMIANADSPARWTVSGDAMLDPRTINEIAGAHGAMLWEWRPGFSTQLGGGSALSIGERPYVVVCKLSAGFLNDLTAHIFRHHAGAGDRDANRVVEILATRGIGFNSLLAKGGNHATGALGHFFAARLMDGWIGASGDSLRLCLPFDAADGLLRRANTVPSATGHRCDLLALCWTSPTLSLVPIELKTHIGQQPSVLGPACEQVRLARALLHGVAVEYLERPALVRHVLAILVDAGLILSPDALGRSTGTQSAAAAIAALLSGSAKVVVGDPVVMEFANTGSDIIVDGDAVAGFPLVHTIRVDPSRSWGEFFGSSGTSMDSTVARVISLASGCASADPSEAASKDDTSPLSPTRVKEGYTASPDSGVSAESHPPPVSHERLHPPVVVPAAPADLRTHEGMPSGTSIPKTRQPQPELPGTQPERPPAWVSPKRGGATDRALQRYQQVIKILTEHRASVVPVQDEPAIEGPGFYVFRVGLRSGEKAATVYKLSEELKLGLRLDAGHEARLYADRGAVVIEIPKHADERYYMNAEELWSRTEWPEDKLYAPLGVDVKDEVVGIDFSSSHSPHLLIGGMTGGGKSVALETLLWGLVKHYPAERLKLWLVDPKGNEFIQFETAPHVRTPIGMDSEDAIEMLTRGVEEMERRYKLMKQASSARGSRVADISAYNALVDESERFPWIVVVLDEFADLTAEKEPRKAIEALLQRLAQKARACGIHCVVATQKPSAEVISTTTRSNLGAQLALRVRSAVDSRVIMESSGAESLAGNGDGFLRLSGQEPIRIQCAKTP